MKSPGRSEARLAVCPKELGPFEHVFESELDRARDPPEPPSRESFNGGGTAHAARARRDRQSAGRPAGCVQPGRGIRGEIDRDDVESLLAVEARIRAIPDGADVFWREYDAFGEQPPEGELKVVSRRAHRHRQHVARLRRIAQPDLERFLHRQLIGTASQATLLRLPHEARGCRDAARLPVARPCHYCSCIGTAAPVRP